MVFSFEGRIIMVKMGRNHKVNQRSELFTILSFHLRNFLLEDFNVYGQQSLEESVYSA